ncbi:unnamed protein product [Chrysoparadoxa australica]
MRLFLSFFLACGYATCGYAFLFVPFAINPPPSMRFCASPGGDEEVAPDLEAFRAKLMAQYGAEQKEKEAEEAGRWANALEQPECGCLLLASEGEFTETQQYFYKSVILLTEHGDDGTVGLILNKPSEYTMGDVTGGPGVSDVPGFESNRLYIGGDVGAARQDGLDVVNLMHGREDVPGMQVSTGPIRLGGLAEAIQAVKSGKASAEEFKFFSRYAGWSPGQLAGEVKDRVWIVAKCDVQTILDQHEEGGLWEDILRRMGGKFADMA